LNFSLIIFALGFRFFFSLFSENGFGFFYQGLIWLGASFILGNLLYYGRMFAGGDAKLMIALGPVISMSHNFTTNLKIFVLFFILFLFVGAFYGLVWSIALALNNVKRFKKEFLRRFNEKRKLLRLIMIFGGISVFLGIILDLYLVSLLGVLIFIFPYFYLYAKSVDEACMIKKTFTKDLTEGDWLYRDIKVGRKTIKANWNGLGKKDIELIKKKHKSILIRQGIPFVPVFLVSYIVLGLLNYFGYFEWLWNSLL